jgi:ABC-2 type transport system ATP-binding protein
MVSKENTDEIAIKVQHVGKTFEPQSSSRTIKEGFVGLGRKLTGKKQSKHHKGEYTALRDISFEVKKGDFFGIVGKNGCGKSTLLKILAGVYTPSEGKVQINGKLTPFIELGVGFNPELSGRDNVFLNGALLGFTRQQMEEMYDDIVDFAELHDFMDTKLKNYSSGMQVRLAFSVAIRAESDILLIDEVLAVGDAAFQQKCFRFFDQLKENKRTIVFVTHDMNSVRTFCDKALFIENHKILSISTPDKISDLYENKNLKSRIERKKISVAEKLRVSLYNETGDSIDAIRHGEQFTISLEWDKNIKNVSNIGIIIFKGSEAIFATNTINRIKRLDTNKVSLIVKDNKLGNGRYRIYVGLYGTSMNDAILINQNAFNYSIYGTNRIGKDNDEWDGIMYLENKWRKNV